MAIDTTPSTVATTALTALPFSSLIGGPLDACIKAQALAAKTSWEFIKNVGLTTDPKTNETKAVNVTFQYQRGGEMVNLVVPLLTIVPIPYISIDTINIDFLANISASSSTVSEQTSSETVTAEGSGGASIGYGPFSANLNFKAGYSAKKDSKSAQDSRYSVEYTMAVKVAASQASMPAGLGAVLNILQSSITEASPRGSLVWSPNTGTLYQRDEGSVAYFEIVAKTNQGVVVPDQALDVAHSATHGKLKLKLEATRGTGGAGKFKTDGQGVLGLKISIEKGEGGWPMQSIKLSAGGTIKNPPTNPGDPAPRPSQVSATATLTVIPAPSIQPPTQLNILPTTVELSTQAKEKPVTVTVTRDGAAVEGYKLKASSDAVTVATIADTATTDKSGKAELAITWKGQGEAQMTVEAAADSTVKGTVKVKAGA